jgi:hypothetical protein
MRAILLSGAGTLLLTGGLLAQGKAPKPHVKIKEADARATALARVPNSTVKAEELEREGERWIYSYDLTVPGKSGIEEVNVDANTGKVVAVEHEGPRAEAKEKAADTKAAAKARAVHR